MSKKEIKTENMKEKRMKKTRPRKCEKEIEVGVQEQYEKLQISTYSSKEDRVLVWLLTLSATLLRGVRRQI